MLRNRWHETENVDKRSLRIVKLVAITMGWPFLFPIAIGALIMMGIFIGCGWSLVGMTFFVSATFAAVGISGMIGAFANTTNGFGAVALALGIGFISIGMIYPTFQIAKEFLKGYLILIQVISRKIVNIRTRMWNK